MSREEWKESGTEVGHAFTTFGKTFVRSAKTTGKKVSDWAEDKKDEEQPEPNSSVYADGSWKKAGKELGGAFAGMGKTFLHTIGVNAADGKPKDETKQAEKDETKTAEPEVTETDSSESVSDSE